MARKRKAIDKFITPTQECEPVVETGVELTMVRTPFNTWGCYIDGTLAEWGGGEMLAKQILRALAGRGVAAEHHVTVTRLPDSGEFPRSLEDLEEFVA